MQHALGAPRDMIRAEFIARDTARTSQNKNVREYLSLSEKHVSPEEIIVGNATDILTNVILNFVETEIHNSK